MSPLYTFHSFLNSLWWSFHSYHSPQTALARFQMTLTLLKPVPNSKSILVMTLDTTDHFLIPGFILWYWCFHSLQRPSLMALNTTAMLMSPNLTSATWTCPLMPDLCIWLPTLQSPWIHSPNFTYPQKNSWFPFSPVCTSASLSLFFQLLRSSCNHSRFLIQPPRLLCSFLSE